MVKTFEHELIVDNFAGGGGASHGIERALGRSIDIAINHNAEAIAMHAANHPATLHLNEDVWKVNPKAACKGRPVGLAWFSPDCRHFSRAKGAKPVSPRVRGLAWVAIRWAREVSPRIIILENVREFRDWGPLIPRLGPDGKPLQDLHGNPVLVPDPTRIGQSFRRFVGHFRGLGYTVEWRDMDAADYGAPTHRRRLFLIARNDGQAIVWPEATHGPGRAQAYRSAAECIDWSLPCPSIFERKRPLAENTMRRIACGLKKYVLESANPFIVQPGHGEGVARRSQGIYEPLRTVTGSNEHGVVAPYLVRIGQTGSNGKSCNSLAEPLGSVVSKAEHLVVAPYLVPRHKEAPRQKPRTHSVEEPFPVVCAENAPMVVAPYLMTNTTGHTGAKAESPLPTQTSGNHHYLLSPWIAKHFGGQVGADARRPVPTTTARGTQNQLAAAFLVHQNHGEKQWTGADEPMRTVTAGGRHAAEVRAFMVKYYGAAEHGQTLFDPLGTATAKARFGLVTVEIGGEPFVVVDIGMRMLTPRELARAQGFPDSYILTGTKTNQVARIGNSVCPVMAEMLVRANYAPAKGVKVA